MEKEKKPFVLTKKVILIVAFATVAIFTAVSLAIHIIRDDGTIRTFFSGDSVYIILFAAIFIVVASTRSLAFTRRRDEIQYKKKDEESRE
ncbi:MAG: hypothetical protein FWB91_09710 [Defluviitaleaceae bacterium]|nr:hypothetical protein [Defluviitaleaceae bacterium]